jgi:hypothetical protein
LDIIGDSLTDTANVARVLEEAAKKRGLEINTEKTKIMELIDSGDDPYEMEDLIYEKVSDFKIFRSNFKHKKLLGKRNKCSNK